MINTPFKPVPNIVPVEHNNPVIAYPFALVTGSPPPVPQAPSPAMFNRAASAARQSFMTLFTLGRNSLSQQ